MMQNNKYTLFILGGDDVGPVSIDITDDLTQRLKQEASGRLSQSRFRLDKLIHLEHFSCPLAARKRASALRQASFQWLSSFILSGNATWEDLRDIQTHTPYYAA